MMLACRMVSHGPSTETPPRWMTLSAPLTDRRDLVRPGEVGGHEGLARLQVLGLHPVAQHQAGIERRQQRPDHGADAARRAGEHDAP